MRDQFVIFRCISSFFRQNKTDWNIKFGTIYTGSMDQMNVPSELKIIIKSEIEIIETRLAKIQKLTKLNCFFFGIFLMLYDGLTFLLGVLCLFSLRSLLDLELHPPLWFPMSNDLMIRDSWLLTTCGSYWSLIRLWSSHFPAPHCQR